jgi:sulfur relay protein TusB/DsrH
MLFLVNKTQPNLFDLIALLGGDEDKEVLLIGDAVFYGTDAMAEKFRGIGIEKLYASKTCLATRSVRLSKDFNPLDYDEMVPLIMEKHDKIVSL